MDAYAETLSQLGDRAKSLRILRNLQQSDVARRADVGLATVRRFELTGRTSLENALRIANVLGAAEGFDSLFAAPKYRTLDEVLAESTATKRRRVRRSR